jgi:hypothetical protein
MGSIVDQYGKPIQRDKWDFSFGDSLVTQAWAKVMLKEIKNRPVYLYDSKGKLVIWAA